MQFIDAISKSLLPGRKIELSSMQSIIKLTSYLLRICSVNDSSTASRDVLLYFHDEW